MKAIIIDTFNYYELRTQYVYKELLRLGYDVSMIVSDFNHITKSKWEETRDNTDFVPTKPYYKNLSFARICSHSDFAKKAYCRICKTEPDVIYCLLPLNSLAKKVEKYKKRHKNTKVFFDIYDLWPESMPVGKSIKRLLFPWRNLRDKHLKCADKIFSECEYYKKFLPENFDYTVVYLCKEKRNIEYKHDDVLRFLYLGSINNIIDVDGIVKLLSDVNKQRSVCLEIVGGGEAEKELLDKLTQSQVPFVNHGKIFDEEKKDEITSRCHFGINMYKKGLCIGLTMKSLDYFCRGLPIVNSNIYDTARIIDEYKCGMNVEDFRNEILGRFDLLCSQWSKISENCSKAFTDCFSVSKIYDVVNSALAK